MTKRDFELIASIIAALPDDIRATVAHAFAQAFSATSPEFKLNRFLTACGV